MSKLTVNGNSLVLDIHLLEQNLLHGNIKDAVVKQSNSRYEVIQWTISRNALNAGGI